MFDVPRMLCFNVFYPHVPLVVQLMNENNNVGGFFVRHTSFILICLSLILNMINKTGSFVVIVQHETDGSGLFWSRQESKSSYQNVTDAYYTLYIIKTVLPFQRCDVSCHREVVMNKVKGKQNKGTIFLRCQEGLKSLVQVIFHPTTKQNQEKNRLNLL